MCTPLVWSKGKAIAIVAGFIVIIVCIYVYIIALPTTPPTPEAPVPESALTETPNIATTTVLQIGTSTNGLPLYARTFGHGDTHILFVGGMHGGYEWNSIKLAYEAIDAILADQITIPENITVSIIPSLNPDGATLITGSGGRFDSVTVQTPSFSGEGRMNARGVDLNRNFDCKWQATSTWRGIPVSAGTAPFSEPEAAALRDYVQRIQPAAAVFWHSKAGAVYGSECAEGILATTTRIMNTYATASGYLPIPLFDAYPITGDAEGWLASRGIPAITVELSTHTGSEWAPNQAGIIALLKLFSSVAPE